MADNKNDASFGDEKADVLHRNLTPDVPPEVIANEIAHEVENHKFSPWTKSMFQLYGVLFVAYCCGCLNGYDGSLMGALNGMTSYQQTFNMLVAPQKLHVTSTMLTFLGKPRARLLELCS